MKAAWYADFGPAAEVIETGEVETPTPGPGEARVRIAASGVNPVDVKRRKGGRGAMEASRVIPHFDGAGVIDTVGDGVPETRVGERVWLYEAQWQSATGSAAEFAVVAADRAVALAEHTSFAEGAALGIPAMTAHRCVYADGPVEGQTVLVTGGAGGVGRYAVQMAKLGGARVVATVSSAEKAAQAEAAGADHVVDYQTEDQIGGNLATSLDVLAPNGVIAAYASDAVLEPAVPFYRLAYANAAVRHVLVFGMPEAAKQQAIADITRWLGAGALGHHIGQRFALAETAAAHQAVEAGAFGKVVVEFGEAP